MNHKSLTGRTALVTSGTSGIGFYTSLALAKLGAVVYITGRDATRGKQTEEQIRTAANHENVHFIRADVSIVGGNKELARRMIAEVAQLHILINNVGGLYNDLWFTADSYEASLAMNFVGPFALTEALLPLLQKSAPARIVNVTSAGYGMWRGDLFVDIQSRKTFSGGDAYNKSRYLNLLWTLALARRVQDSGVVANAFHPGTASTAMTKGREKRNLPSNWQSFWPVMRLLPWLDLEEKVAYTSIYLASAPEAATINGQYFESSTRPKQLSEEMIDVTKQEKTWEFGVSLVQKAYTANFYEPELVL